MTTTTTSTSSYMTQMRFAHALAIVRAIPQNSTLQPISAADKLQFYGLYKQATEGDVNIPRPSSRQVVDYAKWKAWCRMKGITPIEAQKLYVDSLIQLLTELVHRYPRHEQSSFLQKALHSLEFDFNEEEEEKEEEQQQQEEELFQDAYEVQEHFLNHIEAEHIMDQQELLLNSPPPSAIASSFRSTPASYNTKNKSYNRQNSFSEVANTIADYPLTPITSPGGQNSVTGQWVLNQLQQHNSSTTNNKTTAYVHPMDYLQGDIVSEADTCDREVAAATANLILSSPRQSPYTPAKKSSPHLSSASTATSSSAHEKTKPNKNKKGASSSVDTRALEKLQTEVTALTEQIDRLRRESAVSKQQQFQWTKLFKTVIKYLMANSAILLILFYILWKKKSPIAYKVIDSIMPFLQLIIRKIIRRVVFWKVTV